MEIDKHKLWLVLGITLAVLTILSTLFYPALKGTLAGKAVGPGPEDAGLKVTAKSAEEKNLLQGISDALNGPGSAHQKISAIAELLKENIGLLSTGKAAEEKVSAVDVQEQKAGTETTMPLEPGESGPGKTYYVSSSGGNDNDDGLSEQAPWRTLSKVNSHQFQPGDKILLKKGDIWREELIISLSGEKGRPITFSSYGQGANPLILRTEIYDDWWEKSLIENGGFEIYLPSGSSPWFVSGYGYQPSWGADHSDYELIDEQNPSHKNPDNAVLKITGGSILQNVQFVPNKEYYLELYAKRDVGAPPLKLKLFYDKTGSGNKAVKIYLQPDLKSWSAKPAEIEMPNIPEKSWKKVSVVFKSPLEKTGDVRLQLGPFARSKKGIELDDIYLVYGSSRLAQKIWAGNIKGIKGSYGAMKGGTRVPKEIISKDAPQFSVLLNNGFFGGKIAKNEFYYRYDQGYPGSLEVGARQFGIRIKDASYITIEGIDVSGPGALPHESSPSFEKGSQEHQGIRVDGLSNNILLRNLKVSHSSSHGIMAEEETENVTYQNLISTGNADMGLYARGKGTAIISSTVYNNAKVITDIGDTGGIGVWNGPAAVKSNKVYDNAQHDKGESLPGKPGDAEITVWAPKGKVVVADNSVYNCGQACIGIGSPFSQEKGTSVEILNNVIDNFGSSTILPLNKVYSTYSGIRVAGVNDVTIKANTIKNGFDATDAGDKQNSNAGIYVVMGSAPANVKSERLKIISNTFENNLCKDIDIHKTAETKGYEFDYNTYSDKKDCNWRYLGPELKQCCPDFSCWQKLSGLDKNSKAGG